MLCIVTSHATAFDHAISRSTPAFRNIEMSIEGDDGAISQDDHPGASRAKSFHQVRLTTLRALHVNLTPEGRSRKQPGDLKLQCYYPSRTRSEYCHDPTLISPTMAVQLRLWNPYTLHKATKRRRHGSVAAGSRHSGPAPPTRVRRLIVRPAERSREKKLSSRQGAPLGTLEEDRALKKHILGSLIRAGGP
ncbi:hypothetical protein NMY22_g1326 [Coprinellus aureogranulatus]|nr:hypothetical protein NMY22_g1326 [Coprinellus aureogranulatus]